MEDCICTTSKPVVSIYPGTVRTECRRCRAVFKEVLSPEVSTVKLVCEDEIERDFIVHADGSLSYTVVESIFDDFTTTPKDYRCARSEQIPEDEGNLSWHDRIMQRFYVPLPPVPLLDTAPVTHRMDLSRFKAA